jgi:hypothetical protein
MSNEQQVQQDKNTFDIRKIKNVIWILTVLFGCGTFIWGLAARSTNKDNADMAFKANQTTFQADQKRQNEDMKKYIDQSNQRTRTKDSTDIASVNATLINLVNTTRLEMSGEIRLLRLQCHQMTTESKLSRTEHYFFDKNGNRVVESEANK